MRAIPSKFWIGDGMSPLPAFVWTAPVRSFPDTPWPSRVLDSSCIPRLTCFPAGTRAMSRSGRVRPGRAICVLCADEACELPLADVGPQTWQPLASLVTCNLLLLLVPDALLDASARPAAATTSTPAAAKASRNFRT